MERLGACMRLLGAKYAVDGCKVYGDFCHIQVESIRIMSCGMMQQQKHPNQQAQLLKGDLGGHPLEMRSSLENHAQSIHFGSNRRHFGLTWYQLLGHFCNIGRQLAPKWALSAPNRSFWATLMTNFNCQVGPLNLTVESCFIFVPLVRPRGVIRLHFGVIFGQKGHIFAQVGANANQTGSKKTNPQFYIQNFAASEVE